MSSEEPAAADPASEIPTCKPIVSTWEDQSLRIASIFIILVASAIGVFLPLLVHRTLKGHKAFFAVVRFFGTGIFISTAFMHLLSPAQESLGDPCLGHLLPEYDWANGIAMMTIMAMLLVDLMASRHDFHFSHHSHGESNGAHLDSLSHRADHGHADSAALEAGLAYRDEDNHPTTTGTTTVKHDRDTTSLHQYHNQNHPESRCPSHPSTLDIPYPPGGSDHLGHSRTRREDSSEQHFAAQLAALLILEGGVLFHSFFVGLVLSGTDNLRVLVVVLAFHQFFEGLGLGSRLATATWPSGGTSSSGKSTWPWCLSQSLTPWYLAGAYALTTPLAIAIGLGLRESLAARPDATILANGIFDAVSAGILLYVAMVELLAHEFIFSPEMKAAKTRVVLGAYACVALGAGLMAVLAKWA